MKLCVMVYFLTFYRKEHKKHAPKCPLVKLNKKETEWKIEDVLRLEIKRQENIVVSSLQDTVFWYAQSTDFALIVILENSHLGILGVFPTWCAHWHSDF